MRSELCIKRVTLNSRSSFGEPNTPQSDSQNASIESFGNIHLSGSDTGSRLNYRGDLFAIDGRGALRGGRYQAGGSVRAPVESGKSCLLVYPTSPADGIGILTQKDLVSAVFDYAEDLDDTLVSDPMTATAVQMMRNLGMRRVPVVEFDKLVGIVSLTDVFQRAAAALLND